jgi:hypothetical protein
VDLSVGLEVLKHATTTNTEVLAARLDAVLGGFQDLDHVHFVEIPAHGSIANPQCFARQSAVDKSRFPIDPSHAAAVMAQVLNGDFNGFGR